MHRLNLGILAHVDAGKTSLTERLLFETGTIAALGSVDAGTTRTDTMALERRRGITIRTNVASFTLGDETGRTHVNLIDTPGHSDSSPTSSAAWACSTRRCSSSPPLKGCSRRPSCCGAPCADWAFRC